MLFFLCETNKQLTLINIKNQFYILFKKEPGL